MSGSTIVGTIKSILNKNLITGLVGIGVSILCFVCALNSPAGLYTMETVLIAATGCLLIGFSLLSIFTSKNSSRIAFVYVLYLAVTIFAIARLVMLINNLGPGKEAILADEINYSTDTARILAAELFTRESIEQIVFYSISFPFLIGLFVFSLKKALDGENNRYYIISFLGSLLFVWLGSYVDVNALNNLTTMDFSFFAELFIKRFFPFMLLISYLISLENDYDPYIVKEKKKVRVKDAA